ncbi:unnamed protein product [Bemisia tabaci]|uniref:Uncharacterized protein n=1 Tax=Bemisia tabaci TaxID=7038 RepID=A0A9P0AD86_BEMTA|nr:unnamed protein product [Bemisia tabaci]
MFRGFRSVICFEEECIKYDPFRGSLITHTQESDTYFDFPLVPPRGQNYLINLYNNEEPFDEYFGLKNWKELASFTLLAIAKNLGGDIKFEIDNRAENDTLDPENYNMALKTDADLVIFEGSLADKDFRNIEVRFTPLDTAEELRESDFLFQAVNTTDDKSHLIFTEDPRYEWLKNRSIDSMYTMWKELRSYGAKVGYDEIFDEVYQLEEMNVSDFTVKEIYKSLREMLYRDGFILFFPEAAGHKDLMTVEDPQIVNRSHYYHIVREPIMSWPFDMRVLSSSVYCELFKSIVMRLTEGGILTKWFERFTDPTWYEHFIQFEDEKGQPRAFSMKDLRLGFICLVLGSLFSSFVFMAEIVYSG